MGTYFLRPHIPSAPILTTNGAAWFVFGAPTFADSLIADDGKGCVTQGSGVSLIASIYLNTFDFYLDGSLTPVSLSGLPPGFTPTSATIYYTQNGVNNFGNYFLRFNAFLEDTAKVGANFVAFTGPGPFNGSNIAIHFDHPAPMPTALALYNDAMGVRFVQTSGAPANGILQPDSIFIFGNYNIVQSQFTISNPTIPVKIGDKVVVTSATGGLDQVDHIVISYVEVGVAKTITIDIDSFYIIFWSSSLFEFYLPLDLGTFSGTITISFVSVDGGTQFSGSTTLGTLPVLFENASGIYALDTNQIHDTLYFRDGYITVPNQIMLPNMRAENEEILEEDFFNSLPYPYRILAQDDYSEDTENFDFSIVSSSQLAANPSNVEIPSPFIRTAFLP